MGLEYRIEVVKPPRFPSHQILLIFSLRRKKERKKERKREFPENDLVREKGALCFSLNFHL